MPRTYRVGVVGCGVAGTAAAYLLAKAGHAVTLFERAPQVGPVGAGILLQPSGQAVLRDMGLLEPVAARAEPIEELHALHHDGRTLVRLPYRGVAKGCRAYGVHRGDLFGVLHAAALGQGVTVHLGREMRSAVADGRAAVLRDANGGEHGPFDFVLAADGSRSELRKRSALAVLRWPYGYGALWAVGRCQAVRGKLHQVVRGTRNLLGLLPMGGGRCSLFWGVRNADKAAIWRRGFAAWRAEVLAFCPLAEEVFETVTDFDHVTYATYQHVWMPSWHGRRLLFLGDAAHAMSPHLGQGVNFALADAACFAACLAEGRGIEPAFRAYERRRAGPLRFYAAITFALTPFFQSGGWVKALGRDVALPLMTRVPWVRRQMLLSMAGLKGGFLRGQDGAASS